MKLHCFECMFFDHFKGECHKYVPIRYPRKFISSSGNSSEPNRMRDETLTFGWPKVVSDDWCGEAEPK